MPALIDDLKETIGRRRVKIILVKTNICRMLEAPLKAVGFNVINNGITVPFPGCGQQNKFFKVINQTIMSKKEKTNFEMEFQTVNILLKSDCETRGIDAFSLSIIKTERQMRKLFTHLIFQFPAFTFLQISQLIDALAKNKKVYFEGFIKGFDKIYPKTIQQIYGRNYERDLKTLKGYLEIRNKIFHGQLSGKDLSRKELYEIVDKISGWCLVLSRNAKDILGYDGFARKSYQKSKIPDAFSNLKIEIESIDEYKNFIRKNMQR
jgi:hypothetical protein